MPNRAAQAAVALSIVAAIVLAGACVRDKAELNTEEPSCPEGLSACHGQCVDIDLDRAHCGGCDQACPPELVCSLAMCGLECVGGTLRCASEIQAYYELSN